MGAGDAELREAAKRYRALAKLGYGSRLVAHRKKLFAEAAKRVVRWEWLSNTYWRPCPFYSERNRFPKPRRLTEPPKKTDKMRLGYDELGRVLLCNDFDSERDEKGASGYMRVFTYGAHAVDGIEFGSSTANWVTRSRLDADGRVRVYVSTSDRGSRVEVHEYDGQRLARIRTTYRDFSDTDRWVEEFSYDALGSLERIDVVHGGERSRFYSRPKKGETVATLSALVEERLIAAIPAAVRRVKVMKPVYCLALSYDPGSSSALPPSLSLGFDADRKPWLAKGAKDADNYLWNPDEWSARSRPSALDLSRDGDLVAACDALNQRLATGTSTPLRKLLQRVSTALAAAPIAGLRATDDFVVYPVDLELSDLRGNLKAVLPPERFRALERRGHLPPS